MTPAVVSGKAANSLHSPIKPTAPGSKVAVPSAANRTVLSNKQHPSASVVTPTKAGQKLPGPGKPGQAVAAVSQAGQSKAPVMTKAPESCSSSSSESEEEKEITTVKASAPKVGKEPAGQSECMCCALTSLQIRSQPYHQHVAFSSFAGKLKAVAPGETGRILQSRPALELCGMNPACLLPF